MSTDGNPVSIALSLPTALVRHIDEVAARLCWPPPEFVNVAASVGLRLMVSSLGLAAGMSPIQRAAARRGYLQSVSPANLLHIAGIDIGDDSDSGTTESITVSIPRGIYEPAQALTKLLHTDLNTLTALGIATSVAFVAQAATDLAIGPEEWESMLSGEFSISLLQRLVQRSAHSSP